MFRTLLRDTANLLAAISFLLCITTFYLSLNHPISADLAVLHYSAWLINEQHFVLYRDIFDINLPAPYLFHSLLGKILGYNTLPLRWVDFLLMGALGWASWKIISPLSKAAAINGFSLFCLLYWINGGEFILERDVLALVAAAIALALACNTPVSRSAISLTGIFAALACSMKPNTIVIFPALFWILYQQTTPLKIKKFILFFIAASLTAVLPFIWIIASGGWNSFLKIYEDYLPIYANSRYDLWHYDSERERWTMLFKQYLQFGGLSLLLSAPGLVWAWLQHRHHAEQKKRILQLAVITFSFTLYEVIAGKFWTNHLFPSAYWSFLCFSLLLCTPQKTAPYWQHIVVIVLFILTMILMRLLAGTVIPAMQQAHEREINEPNTWRARQIAGYLSAQHLQNTDTVQVLDMAGDGQAALLLAKATSATRFLIDVPLWMQPDSATTQALRQEFVTELQQKKPAYIVYVEQFYHPGGGNRLKEFKQLYQWINNDYNIAEQKKGAYIIFHRK